MKTALSQLWDDPSLHTWQKLKRRELEKAMRGLVFTFCGGDLSPMGNSVKKFLLADLVVYFCSCETGYRAVPAFFNN